MTSSTHARSTHARHNDRDNSRDEDDEDVTSARTAQALRAQLLCVCATLTAMQKDCDVHARHAEQLLQRTHCFAERVTSFAAATAPSSLTLCAQADVAATTTTAPLSSPPPSHSSLTLFVACEDVACAFVPAVWPTAWLCVLCERIRDDVLRLRPADVDAYWQTLLHERHARQRQEQQQQQQRWQPQQPHEADVAGVGVDGDVAAEQLTRCSTELLSLLAALLPALHIVSQLSYSDNDNDDVASSNRVVNNNNSSSSEDARHAHVLWQVYWLRHLYSLLCATLRGLAAVLAVDDMDDNNGNDDSSSSSAHTRSGDGGADVAARPRPALYCLAVAITRASFSCEQCAHQLTALLPLVRASPSPSLLLCALTCCEYDGVALSVACDVTPRVSCVQYVMPAAVHTRHVDDTFAYLQSLLA